MMFGVYCHPAFGVHLVGNTDSRPAEFVALLRLEEDEYLFSKTAGRFLYVPHSRLRRFIDKPTGLAYRVEIPRDENRYTIGGPEVPVDPFRVRDMVEWIVHNAGDWTFITEANPAHIGFGFKIKDDADAFSAIFGVGKEDKVIAFPRARD